MSWKQDEVKVYLTMLDSEKHAVKLEQMKRYMEWFLHEQRLKLLLLEKTQPWRI